MTTVLLIRHGRTSANTAGVLAGRSEGVRLDEVGHHQVAALAERVGRVPLVALVSSPLERCRQTGEALLGAREDDTARRSLHVLTNLRGTSLRVSLHVYNDVGDLEADAAAAGLDEHGGERHQPREALRADARGLALARGIELKQGERVVGQGEPVGTIYRLSDGRTIVVEPKAKR